MNTKKTEYIKGKKKTGIIYISHFTLHGDGDRSGGPDFRLAKYKKIDD